MSHLTEKMSHLTTKMSHATHINVTQGSIKCMYTYINNYYVSGRVGCILFIANQQKKSGALHTSIKVYLKLKKK